MCGDFKNQMKRSPLGRRVSPVNMYPLVRRGMLSLYILWINVTTYSDPLPVLCDDHGAGAWLSILLPRPRPGIRRIRCICLDKHTHSPHTLTHIHTRKHSRGRVRRIINIITRREGCNCLRRCVDTASKWPVSLPAISLAQPTRACAQVCVCVRLCVSIAPPGSAYADCRSRSLAVVLSLRALPWALPLRARAAASRRVALRRAACSPLPARQL